MAVHDERATHPVFGRHGSRDFGRAENTDARPVKTEIPDGKIKRNMEMLKKHGLSDDPLFAGIVAIAMAQY